MSLTSALTSTSTFLATWSIPLRLLASALISAIVGSGLLGFLFEYSTHTYALYFGFRPPVEGIPHLRTTVVGGSFLLLASGALIALALVIALRRSKYSGNVSAATHKVVGLAALSLAALLFIVSIGCEWLLPSVCSKPVMQIADVLLGMPLGFLLGVSASSLSSWKPALSWWIPVIAVAAYYLWVLAQLFSPNTHASLLRKAGFGGGLAISLRLDAGSTEPPIWTNGFLMLRTSEYVVLLSQDLQSIQEYPLQRIVRIQYGAYSFGSEQYALPTRPNHPTNVK
jgi:hypothetical protein